MSDLLSEIKEISQISDPIKLIHSHKLIIDKISLDASTLPIIGTNDIFQYFLQESFSVFANTTDYYKKCVDILYFLAPNISLCNYTEIINELTANETYKPIGLALQGKLQCKRKESYTEPCKRMKRTKKVSFKSEITVVYIEKKGEDYNKHRNYKDEAHNEYQKIYAAKFEERSLSVDWHKPEILENNSKNRSEMGNEENVQEIRESKRIRFTNNSIHNKFLPEDLSKPNNWSEASVKEIPLVDLKVQNVWKKMDFVKIVENKDLDLKNILDEIAVKIKFKETK